MKKLLLFAVCGLLSLSSLLATDVYFEPVGNMGLTPYASAPTTFAIDDAGEKLAVCFIEQEARTAHKIGFYVSSVTGTTATYKVSIQGVSSQVPDGTVKGSASPASATVTPSATGWQWVVLDNDYATTFGEALSIVIEIDSGVDSSNYVTFGSYIGSNGYVAQPCGLKYEDAAWTSYNRVPLLSIEYSNGTIIKGTGAIDSITQTQSGWTSSDTSDGTIQDLMRGVYWIPPQNSIVTGCWVFLRDGGDFDFKLNLYEGTSTTATTSTTIAASTFFINTGNVYPFFVPIDSTSLTSGTTYRFVIEPTSTNVCSSFILYTFDSELAKQYLIGDLTACSLSSSGTWTDDSTSVYPVIPVLSARTSSTGSSSNYLINPLSCRLWKNVASQKVYFYAYDFTNNQPKTGFTTSSITVGLSKDGGSRTSISSPTISEIGSGWYVWSPSQENLNCDVANVNFDSASSAIKFSDVTITLMPEIATVSETTGDVIQVLTGESSVPANWNYSLNNLNRLLKEIRKAQRP